MPPIVQAEHDRRLGEFAAWARRRRFTAGRHDAEFHGRWNDAAVELETGIRRSGLYAVVVGVDVALDVVAAPLVLHGSNETNDERLQTLFATHGELAGLRIETGKVTLRMKAGTRPPAIESILESVVHLAKTARVASPYR